MKLDLTSFESYKDSSVRLLHKKLIDFYGEKKFLTLTFEDIKKDIKELNAYPGIKNMKEVDHKEIFVIEEGIDVSAAEKAILEGKIFWEHAAAGEATRLGMGTKYLLMPNELSFDRIRRILITEAMKENKPEDEIKILKNISDKRLLDEIGTHPDKILPISLGLRHMVQLIFDIKKLALKHNLDPDKVIKKQKTLMILNESTSRQISEELRDLNFLGLSPENVLFMEQQSFHGIMLDNGVLFYHEEDKKGNKHNNKRLHNHGQMIMQKLHNDSIFRFVKGNKTFLRREEYFSFIKPCEDMISYNIEDLGYLTDSIDLQSLATALLLKDKGFHMVMEVVGQNPDKPQKGASLFFDERINKNVMIESFRLFDLKNEDLKLMNKNFNHYPNPHDSLKKLHDEALPLGFEIKKAANGHEYIYLCPVQGDLNFIVDTAFVRREKLQPIYNWKTASQTTQALNAMYKQDNQKGFKELIQKLGLLD